MIRKVGLTSGELSKVVTIRLALLFFVPIGVATLHGAVALTALGQMFEYSLFKENTIVLKYFRRNSSCILLNNTISLFKTIEREITYSLTVFFNLSTKFSKKIQVLPKSDKMEKARWKINRE